jgi:hypothetical protein
LITVIVIFLHLRKKEKKPEATSLDLNMLFREFTVLHLQLANDKWWWIVNEMLKK